MTTSKIYLLMRVYLAFAPCIIGGHVVFCQNSVERFNEFSIQNTSCDVISAVHGELMAKNREAYEAHIADQRRRLGVGTDQNTTAAYITSFNETLAERKKQLEAKEFLWKTKTEIVKYGADVLANYAEMIPTRHLTNFAVPAVQRGLELYLDSETDKKIEDNKAEMDKLVTQMIDISYSTTRTDITKIEDQQAFENVVAIASAEMPGLNREQYGIFSKQLIKYAFKYIQQNRDAIQAMDLRNQGRFDAVRSEFNANLQKYEDEMKAEIKSIGTSIADLTKNQYEIFKTLDDIKLAVKKNEEAIVELEKQMVEVKDDVVKLKEVHAEHAKLIAQNSFRIDILSGYTFQNLNTQQKLDALQKGHFDNLFKNNDEKEELKAQLEKIRVTETIISVATDVGNYANATYKFGVNTGLLKGKDAERVGRAINYLSNSIQIITGAARIFAGDPSGIFSALGGISGFFSKPEKSPELKMMEQMYEAMNARFDHIDKRLTGIETKIDSLASLTISMYKTMANSFQITNEKIDRIYRETHIIREHTRLILQKDYEKCLFVEKERQDAKFKFAKYSDYLSFYRGVPGDNCTKCLQGLNDFITSRGASYFHLDVASRRQELEYVDFIIENSYKPSRDLFRSVYKVRQSVALNSLMFPTKLTSDTNKPIVFLGEMENLPSVSAADALDDYYNYELIIEFGHLFLTYLPYFEIASSGADFRPERFVDYLQIPSEQKALRQSGVKRMLERFSQIINHSMMQQSIVAGNGLIVPAYTILFTANQEDADTRNVIKILKNNTVFAKNFVTYAINRNISAKKHSEFTRLLNLSRKDGSSIDELNGLLTNSHIVFQFDETDKKLKAVMQAKFEELKLNVPEASQIIEDRMINTEGFYGLQELKELVDNKLLETVFTTGFPVTHSEITWKHFKYMFSSN